MPTWQLDDRGRYGGCWPVSDIDTLQATLERFAQQEPHQVHVDINTNEYIDIGIGGRWAWVQYVVNDPWLAKVARGTDEIQRPASLRFLADGALDTEITAKYLMPASKVIELVVHIFRLGALPDSVEWEVV